MRFRAITGDEMTTFSAVKEAIGVTGEYQNETLQHWYNEAVSFLRGAGVPDNEMTTGIVARGVLDLWNYGSGDGKLSEYFMQRAAQLSYK